MNYILFDDAEIRQNLLPFTFLRSVADIRVGILTIAEKWEKYLHQEFSYLVPEYLQEKYPPKETEEGILINAAVLPSPVLVEAIQRLDKNEGIFLNDTLVAVHFTEETTFEADGVSNNIKLVDTNFPIQLVQYPYDIFTLNGAEIANDFKLITKGRKSQEIKDPHTIIYNPENIFVEEGADIKACVLNAEKGVIYIGKNAQIQEMSVIHGNFALGEGAVVNMGAKMRGDTTIGAYCKVGGEISNSVLFGYSNKGHDGFLGNSVIGEWCNLGADTNTSNLKNNYSHVKIWNYQANDYIDTGKQFCGLMMGDHSKAGINTMFNTGTVVGIFANIALGGFPDKHVPSFSWHTQATDFSRNFYMEVAMKRYDIEKALATAEIVMKRRNKSLSDAERSIIRHLFEGGR